MISHAGLLHPADVEMVRADLLALWFAPRFDGVFSTSAFATWAESREFTELEASRPRGET